MTLGVRRYTEKQHGGFLRRRPLASQVFGSRKRLLGLGDLLIDLLDGVLEALLQRSQGGPSWKDLETSTFYLRASAIASFTHFFSVAEQVTILGVPVFKMGDQEIKLHQPQMAMREQHWIVDVPRLHPNRRSRRDGKRKDAADDVVSYFDQADPETALALILSTFKVIARTLRARAANRKSIALL